MGEVIEVHVGLFRFRHRPRHEACALPKSIIQADNAGEQLRLQAKQVVADLHETIARLQTRVTVKEAAQLSYDITQYRYAKGVASRLELADAELALTAAQSNYLEAVYDYLSVQITLDKTIGKVND